MTYLIVSFPAIASYCSIAIVIAFSAAPVFQGMEDIAGTPERCIYVGTARKA